MIVGIHQPNFLPWLGYFYKIARSDVFVFLDNVQYSKNSFTNRNRIKTPPGANWLTVPVRHRHPQLINEVDINSEVDWCKQHLRTLEMNYRRSRGFDEVFPRIESVYCQGAWTKLSELNIGLAGVILKLLGLEKKVVVASELGVNGTSTDLLIRIVKAVGGDTYLSGFGGAKYQDEGAFERADIKLAYYDFQHPVYPQLWGEFVQNLSIVDLVFNCGNESIHRLLEH